MSIHRERLTPLLFAALKAASNIESQQIRIDIRHHPMLN